MKKYLLIIVAFILPDSLIGQERNDVKQKEVSALFQKTEKEMQNHYNYLDKKRIFEDPIGRADYFFKTVKRVAPSLLSDTKLYKNEILNLLIDTTYKKTIIQTGILCTSYIIYLLMIMWVCCIQYQPYTNKTTLIQIFLYSLFFKILMYQMPLLKTIKMRNYKFF